MATYRPAIGIISLTWMTFMASGCVSPHAYYCQDGCGPLFPSARLADCGTVAVEDCADDCAGDCADDCATACAGPACAPCGYGFWSSLLGCRAGCGRMYWGEWAYDPPDACDPCDDYGQWVGPRCCPPSGWITFWRGLCGMRCGGVCGCATGSACDVAAEAGCCDGESHGDEVDAFGEEVWLESNAGPASPSRSPVTTARGPRRSVQPAPTPATPRDPQSRLVRRNRPPVTK
ncbi:MAG: hypothetical protein MUF48_05800 [Pirellulaceae bacterium]|nr:hypothetical protein [Pirellulaceae bacterium]